MWNTESRLLSNQKPRHVNIQKLLKQVMERSHGVLGIFGTEQSKGPKTSFLEQMIICLVRS